jgi:hypothetical protein
MASAALEAMKIDETTPYFSWDKTVSYFPTLHVEEDYIPLGNPK